MPNVNGAASELEASKTAKIDSSAIERAIWSAQPRVKLFCCFFMDVFLLVLVVRIMFVIRHLFPEIRDEVPEKFRMAECFTAFAIWFSASPTKDGAASEVTGRRVSNV